MGGVAATCKQADGSCEVNDIAKFPSAKTEWLIGPFEEYRVLVEGRQIPKLTGVRRADGTVSLSVDHRFCGIFSTERDAEQAAFLIANAMAIGAGYPCLSAPSKEHPFAPVSREIAADQIWGER